WMPTGDGFGGTPGELPTLRETFDAVAAITLANISLENGQQIIEYVGSYRNPDGGFGIAGSYTESTLRAAEIYNLLETPFPNPGETILFLQGLQQGDGGFSKKAGSTVSYVVSTYRAVRALEILGAKPMDTPKTIQYLISNQNPDGGFGGFIGDSSDVSSTYRAVRALNILNSAPSDGNAAIEFLKDSQNPDGGFKRSSYDIQRPANISNIIYSYSAVRGLLILNSNPINSTSLYHFISSTRNRDGGYGEHPDFTSNIAYTYVAFWLLKHMPEISNFKVLLPENLNSTRSSYLEFSVEINGGITPLNYTIYLGTSNTIISSGILTSSGTVIVNTSSLQPGTHTLRLVVFDLSGMTIEANLILLIGTPKQSPIDFLFVFLALMMLGSSVTIYRKWKLR
ncbi:MAG: prenyltransferase/squalene oxidase repeat-containing protein, partial [Candidatus Heimdallarchaeota archaeon]